MLTFDKVLGRIFGRLRASAKRLHLWWLVMSDQEQREIVRMGVVTVGCAIAACTLLPTIVLRYDAQKADADFRAEAKLLAESQSAAGAVRESADASELLTHDWLRTVEHTFDRDPRASLTRYAMYDRDEAALSSVASMTRSRFDEAEEIAREHMCLSQAVYYEAGNERPEGKLAVAEVIMNRVADHRYPNSICEVVFQGATRTTGCQFTFTCDGALGRKPNPITWKRAQTVAAHVIMDLHERRTSSATHYHATYVDPIWNAGLVRTNKIGAHIFYRFPRGSEWSRARDAVARKRARLAQRVRFSEQQRDLAPATASAAPAP